MQTKPIFFGSAARPLYGVYHPASGANRRRSAVLLCYPHVAEYNFAHRAFRQIATFLSSIGFEVFRFDYTGTGDSWGNVGDSGLEQWTSDIVTAAAELKDLGRVSDLHLVGRQLGAVLAARAIASGLPVRRLVMWEPIVSGRGFVDGLQNAHQRACLSRLQPVSEGENPWEALLGFPFPRSLRREIEAIDLVREIPHDLPVGILMSPPSIGDPTYRVFKESIACKGKLVRLVETSSVPQFEPGSVREEIISAGNIPSMIADLLTTVWDKG